MACRPTCESEPSAPASKNAASPSSVRRERWTWLDEPMSADGRAMNVAAIPCRVAMSLTAILKSTCASAFSTAGP